MLSWRCGSFEKIQFIPTQIRLSPQHPKAPVTNSGGLFSTLRTPRRFFPINQPRKNPKLSGIWYFAKHIAFSPREHPDAQPRGGEKKDAGSHSPLFFGDGRAFLGSQKLINLFASRNPRGVWGCFFSVAEWKGLFSRRRRRLHNHFPPPILRGEPHRPKGDLISKNLVRQTKLPVRQYSSGQGV